MSFFSSIPVVTKYVGAELARKEDRLLTYRVVPEAQRKQWIARRTEEILMDVRVLERVVDRAGQSEIYGDASIPEADEFRETNPANTKGDFSQFINTCNRCFVEPIDVFGEKKGKKRYFWEVIKDKYPDFFRACHRVRVYRNERDHLNLNGAVNDKYVEFLDADLEGKCPSNVEDLWFVLQQRVLDDLLYAIQTEITRLS